MRVAVGETRQEGVTELASIPKRLVDNTSLTPQIDVALSFTTASTLNTAPVVQTAHLSSEFTLGGSRAVSTSGDERCRGAPILLSVARFILSLTTLLT